MGKITAEPERMNAGSLGVVGVGTAHVSKVLVFGHCFHLIVSLFHDMSVLR